MKKKKIQLDRIIGIRCDGEFVVINYFFDHLDGSRGAIGTSLYPISKEAYEYRTSQKGAEEYLKDLWDVMLHNQPDMWKQYIDNDVLATTIQDVTICTSIYGKMECVTEYLDVGNDLDKAEKAKDAAKKALKALKEKAFSEYVSQVRQWDGDEAFYDHSGCGTWDQIRNHDPENMNEDKIELFECVGGGAFSHDTSGWAEILDEHLLDWIAWWERGGFRQYTTGILGELNK